MPKKFISKNPQKNSVILKVSLWKIDYIPSYSTIFLIDLFV